MKLKNYGLFNFFHYSANVHQLLTFVIDAPTRTTLSCNVFFQWVLQQLDVVSIVIDCVFVNHG